MECIFNYKSYHHIIFLKCFLVLSLSLKYGTIKVNLEPEAQDLKDSSRNLIILKSGQESLSV